MLLDIQDRNITFEEGCLYDGELKGKPCRYVEGKLTYTPEACISCGVKNEDYTIYKNGTQCSRITLPIDGVKKTYLNLRKQRFKCKACEGTFTATTSLVEKHCYLSKYTKACVLIKATEAQSLQDIAKDTAVSATTVQRLITEEAKGYSFHHCLLPKHLSFDEFKYAKGLMAFEYINAETGDILDILEYRDARKIKDHFIANYSLADRKNVETITIDMNAGYVNVIKAMFPQAEIVIDRFHLTQLINRSMNKTRIRVMNSFHTSNGEDLKKYRRLKRYWRLLLKRQSDLSNTEYKYFHLFGQRLETNVVEELLRFSSELKENYDLYQRILCAFEQADQEALRTLLNHQHKGPVSSYMKTSMKTLRQHLPYIKNSFTYPFNNGRIEGINNKIKVLNRVAYGYRNFRNYKYRILLHFKLRSVESKSTKMVPNQTNIQAV